MDAQGKLIVISDIPGLGAVMVTQEVITEIAAIAATDVKGVASLYGGITRDLVSKVGSKKLSKSVQIELEEDKVNINMAINVMMNEDLMNVSKNVQDKVKQTVQDMTCMDVGCVNVNIANIDND